MHASLRLASLAMPGDMREKLLGAGMKTFYQLFKLSGMDPGAEFKVALEEAERIGARVVKAAVCAAVSNISD